MNWSQPSAGAAALIAAEGTTLVEFRFLDEVANPAGAAEPADASLDRAAPSAPPRAAGRPLFAGRSMGHRFIVRSV